MKNFLKQMIKDMIILSHGFGKNFLRDDESFFFGWMMQTDSGLGGIIFAD